tara:strand:- start:29 stop:268 length:240 start_codon:yes stop_codon:yes gene_type:complete
MNKIFCRTLLLLVNNKEKMQRLQEYGAARIAHYQKLLETTKDHHRILEIQAAIAELRQFETLRDEVIEGSIPICFIVPP